MHGCYSRYLESHRTRHTPTINILYEHAIVNCSSILTQVVLEITAGNKGSRNEFSMITFTRAKLHTIQDLLPTAMLNPSDIKNSTAQYTTTIVRLTLDFSLGQAMFRENSLDAGRSGRTSTKIYFRRQSIRITWQNLLPPSIRAAPLNNSAFPVCGDRVRVHTEAILIPCINKGLISDLHSFSRRYDILTSLA